MSRILRVLQVILACSSIIFFTFSCYNFFLHLKEERAIEQYLKSNGISLDAPLSKELAIKVSEIVYRDFNTNTKTWKHLDLKRRPFLRNSVSELLVWKEGVCGEGARVIVRLLQKLGFDATRINLYTPKLGGTGHVAVSVLLNGKEFFVDTINSPSWFHRLVKESNVGTYCYSIIHYKVRLERKGKECKMLVEHYPLYSYEAIPFSKILNLLGFDVYVLNLSRPNKYISYLAESVYLAKALVLLLLSLFSVSLIVVINNHVRKLMKKREI